MQEPVNQTVKQIHIAFDAVLDILSLQSERAASLGLPAQDVEDFEEFLERTAIDLMALSTPFLLLVASECETRTACMQVRGYHTL